MTYSSCIYILVITVVGEATVFTAWQLNLDGCWAHRNWSLNDSTVQIINPWHWESQCVKKTMGSYENFRDCSYLNGSADVPYNRGAVELSEADGQDGQDGRDWTRNRQAQSIDKHNLLSASTSGT